MNSLFTLEFRYHMFFELYFDRDHSNHKAYHKFIESKFYKLGNPS